MGRAASALKRCRPAAVDRQSSDAPSRGKDSSMQSYGVYPTPIAAAGVAMIDARDIEAIAAS